MPALKMFGDDPLFGNKIKRDNPQKLAGASFAGVSSCFPFVPPDSVSSKLILYIHTCILSTTALFQMLVSVNTEI